jgi:hypothetical protein
MALGVDPVQLRQPPAVVVDGRRRAGRFQHRARRVALPGREQGLRQQRQVVRLAGQRALLTEPVKAVADLAGALGAAGAPAGQDQAPVAVVGEVVAGADLLDPAGELHGRLGVAAQLVGDRRVGQRDGQAIGVLRLLAAADRPVAPVQRLLVAAEQPEGVRGPGPCVHLDPGAEQVRWVVLAQFVGQCEVRQRLLVPPQAGRRPSHREVRLPGGVAGQRAQLQAAVGDLVGLGDVPLHVTDAEQPHEDEQL